MKLSLIECHDIIEEQSILRPHVTVTQVLRPRPVVPLSSLAGAGLIANMRRVETIVKHSSVN